MIPLSEGRPTRRTAPGHLRGRPGARRRRSREADELRELRPRDRALYVATPALLRHLGIDPATVDPTADFLADPTVPTEELVILNFAGQEATRRHERPEDRQPGGPRRRRGRSAAAVPSSFVTLEGLRRHGWKQVASGWLVESSRPLTSEQIATARELAADAGLDDRDHSESAPPSRRPLRSRPPQAPCSRSRSWP